MTTNQSWTLGRHWFASDGTIFQEWLRGPHTRLRVTNFLPGPRGYDRTFEFVSRVSDCDQVVSEFCELNGWTLTGSAVPKPGTPAYEESMKCRQL